MSNEIYLLSIQAKSLSDEVYMLVYIQSKTYEMKNISEVLTFFRRSTQQIVLACIC